LFAAYEADANETDLTFYFLARYTGQRKGDCCDMGWSDIDLKGNRIHVVQEKTGIKIWVPLHKRLRKYLAALPRRGKHILTSPVTGKRYAKQSITNYVTARCAALGFAGYSAHGLRHSAGVALAEAKCTVPQIMAILGHVTEKQAIHYIKQASQRGLADDGMANWEKADEAVIDNVLPMAAPRKRKYKAA
jgi:integrase